VRLYSTDEIISNANVFMESIKEFDEQMQNLALKMYVKGLSTRDISGILKDVFGKKYSAASISELTKGFEEERVKWQSRKLDEEYYFVFVDALGINIRRDTVENEAFYIVLGLKKDLTREVLGVYTFPTEREAGWIDVFEDLQSRGVRNIGMLIGDGFKGIQNSVLKKFSGIKFQRCIVHKYRNAVKHIRVSDETEFHEDFYDVFKRGEKGYTVEKAKENLKTFVAKWQKRYRSISRQFLKRDIPHYFEYLTMPYQIQKMVYTTNWIERLNKEIRRTTRVRNSFPNENSAMNLICMFLMDKEEKTYSRKVGAFTCVKKELDEMLVKQRDTQTHKN
jgi:transposase-like protein